jgi:hypothetical protein
MDALLNILGSKNPLARGRLRKNPAVRRISFRRHPSTTFTGASHTPFNQKLLAFGGLIKVKNIQIALILLNLNVFI